jgi:altronate dehydratase small subunit
MSSNNSVRDAVALHADDNVATALRALAAGETAAVESPAGHVRVTIREPIARCHKFAVAGLHTGEHIKKYGQVIGAARATINVGEHVHIHNLESLRGK